MTSKFKRGDNVRLTGDRGQRDAFVMFESDGGVRLSNQLAGYYSWNEADLELVPQPRELTDAELDMIWLRYQALDDGPSCCPDHRNYARAVLAAQKDVK